MVILQFNKLIRNKWVWGAFAVVVSAAFCFDDLFTGRSADGPVEGVAGRLGGKDVSTAEFDNIRSDVIGRERGNRTDAEINLETWKRIADLRVADDDGIVVSDAVLGNIVRDQFSYMSRSEFNFDAYRMALAQQGLTPERHENSLRRSLAVNGVHAILVAAGAFTAPMELDVRVADETDSFNVRVARFTQDKAKANAITVDDAALKTWYDANSAKLALPERVKIRYIKIDATKPETLAKQEISADDIQDYYDVNIAKYKSTDTNGVETVKALDEVKEGIERELRIAAAVDAISTDLQRRAYADLAEGEDAKASRLDKIAAEEGESIVVSDWFSPAGARVEGFMQYPGAIAPGARDFAARVAEIDPEDEYQRYNVATSASAVWLFEVAETSPAHTPGFDEAKDKIGPQVLRDLKADAFKAEVGEVIAKGVEAVLASGNVSTNIVFSPADRQTLSFPDSGAIANAAKKLKAGELSSLVTTGAGRGLVVYCESRTAGDAATEMLYARNLRQQADVEKTRAVVDKWEDANLARLEFAPNAGYETTEAPAGDEE